MGGRVPRASGNRSVLGGVLVSAGVGLRRVRAGDPRPDALKEPYGERRLHDPSHRRSEAPQIADHPTLHLAEEVAVDVRTIVDFSDDPGRLAEWRRRRAADSAILHALDDTPLKNTSRLWPWLLVGLIIPRAGGSVLGWR